MASDSDSETESISSQNEQDLTSSESEDSSLDSEQDSNSDEENIDSDDEEQISITKTNKKKRHNKTNSDDELNIDKSDSDDAIDDEDDYDEDANDDEDENTVVGNDIIEVDSKIIDKNCLYKYVNNVPDKPTEIKYITGEDRITRPYLTKYEKVRVLGIRTQQIASGAKPMVKDVKGLSSYKIAKLELKNKVLPLIIQRPLPNGDIEQWKVNELI